MPSADEKIIDFTIERVTFRNAENGFHVLKGRVAENTPDLPSGVLGETALIGSSSLSLAPGIQIRARGIWQSHEKFGFQFRAFSITEKEPNSLDGIKRFLSSGAIKGIGPSTADRIISAFGEKTLEIFENDIDKLKSISGIGSKTLEDIKESWEERKSVKDVLLFFQEKNISIALAQKIHRHYNNRTLEVVKDNPYRLAREVHGIGFLTADSIAMSLGIEKDSRKRISAGILYTLQKASEDGNCFLIKNDCIEKSDRILEIGDQTLVKQVLEENVIEKLVIEIEDKIFLPLLYNAEKEIANDLLIRIKESPKQEIPYHVVDKWINQSFELSELISSQQKKTINLSEEQKQAVELAATSNISILTGGPGCGKTTALRLVAGMFRHVGLNVKLAAPTGRAAQRMSEVCQFEATTIHRLLGVDPFKNRFVHDEENQLEVDALIIDESSMIDVFLANALLKAVPKNTRILFVGDADQLPSVGPGLFLSDMLEFKKIPKTKLSKLFRQEENSKISQIAHELNQGNCPEIPKADGQTISDSYFFEAQNSKKALEITCKLVTDIIPNQFNIALDDITVLSPMNVGELGVRNINNKLQEIIIPSKETLPKVSLSDIEFRLGDRVCQRVNNYNLDTGVFNGDQGKIVGIDADAKTICVKLWDKREINYTSADIKQLDLAYALSVHRSQGSEMQAVVLIVHDSHHIMLERQLIYTGITRAKKLLVVVGTKKALNHASKQALAKKRNTNLFSLLNEDIWTK